MTRNRRPGFSIFDLLVIIAILGILIGLLLPAVQKVREAANRSKSQNNLKQIALAVHNHESTFEKMPQGNDANNYSAFVHLLPFIEQDALYRAMAKANEDFKKPMTDKVNDEFRKVSIKVYLSPDDPRPFVTEGVGATNYLFCAGSKTTLEDNNGVFIQGASRKFADITDGLSNTVMCGETLKGDGGKKGVTVQRQHVRLDKDALKDLKDESGAQDFNENKNIAANRGESWMDGRFLQGTFTATRKLNDDRPDVDCAGAGGLSSLRSARPNGLVVIALCDGSVRSLTPNLSLKTWKNAASANDGNPLGSDW
jgi:type II secretory pathway pseudopilin PulG